MGANRNWRRSLSKKASTPPNFTPPPEKATLAQVQAAADILQSAISTLNTQVSDLQPDAVAAHTVVMNATELAAVPAAGLIDDLPRVTPAEGTNFFVMHDGALSRVTFTDLVSAVAAALGL